MSQGHFYLTALSYLTLKGQPNDFSLFLPVLGGGNVSSPPPIYAKGGGGGGWLGPPLSSVLPTRGRDEGQETTLTQDNLSYVLSSTNTKLYIPNCNNFLITMMDSPFIPSFPSPSIRKLSLVVSPLSWSVLSNHSRGPAVVPVGTRTGDSRIRVSLSNRGGPIKFLGW